MNRKREGCARLAELALDGLQVLLQNRQVGFPDLQEHLGLLQLGHGLHQGTK